MRSLDDYHGIVSDRQIYEIYQKARGLTGKHVLCINSTYQGGGVAELLSSMVPLMNDLGVDMGWRILHGNPDFFTITKKFHNALQGAEVNLTEMKKSLYVRASEDFKVYTHIDHDCVIIHDPQPLPLVRCCRKLQPWIWRCHLDLTSPNKELWDYLKQYLLRYDMMLVSNTRYLREDLPVEQRVVHPALDPLSPKNIEIPEDLAERYLEKFGIPTDKPLITQISRFDAWKDPEGVLQVYQEVEKEVDCRLVLCGSMAADDPEGQEIYERVERKAAELSKNGDVIVINSENNILVNALQRASDVVVQKSLREGFGLTVTEALWKGRPVVASTVGGIGLQITDGENGFLVDPHDITGCAERVVQVLQDEGLARRLGKNARRTVKEKFLITRLLGDWLDVLNDVIL